MTIAMHSRTSWRAVDATSTIGQVDGTFAGTIQRVGDRFDATTDTGRTLGAFPSAADAERALERAADLNPNRVHVASRMSRPDALHAGVFIAGILATGAVAVLALVSL